MKIVGIYNAKGTITGELTYVVKKLCGLGGCSLCDITHGWNPFGKRSWKEAYEKSAIDIRLLHIEEATESQLNAAGELPAFLIEKDKKWGILMPAGEIAIWTDNPTGLLGALEKALLSPNQD